MVQIYDISKGCKAANRVGEVAGCREWRVTIGPAGEWWWNMSVGVGKGIWKKRLNRGELVKNWAPVKFWTTLWVSGSLESPSGVPYCFRRMTLDLEWWRLGAEPGDKQLVRHNPCQMLTVAKDERWREPEWRQVQMPPRLYLTWQDQALVDFKTLHINVYFCECVVFHANP